MEVYRNEFGSFLFKNDFMIVEPLNKENNIIVVTWAVSTQDFTEESLKKCFLEYKHNVLAVYKPEKIVHDLSFFLYPIIPKLQNWIDTEINAYAIVNGIKKIGFVVSPSFYSQLSVEQTMEEKEGSNIVTCYFDNQEAVKEWILL